MSEIITIRPQVPQAPAAQKPIGESVAEEANLSPYQTRHAGAPDIANDDFFGSFADILDVINPLQHIPIVSTFYRGETGDALSAGARIAGGALFGGPVGLAAAVFGSIFEEIHGQDIGSTILSAAFDRYKKTDALS